MQQNVLQIVRKVMERSSSQLDGQQAEQLLLLLIGEVDKNVRHFLWRELAGRLHCLRPAFLLNPIEDLLALQSLLPHSR